MRLFVDNLTNVDFSYLDAERGLVGETWLASIELDGTLDEQGMVCDFGIVKKKLRAWLDETLDHCLLVPEKSAALQIQSSETCHGINWHLSDGHILKVASPHSAITLIDADTITPHSVAQWCIAQLRSQFPASIESLKLTFTWEIIAGPSYHYSHGLKKHDGNCQRIAHGHRSSIEIKRNGKINLQDMTLWAQRWKDMYIGTREDLCTTNESAFDTDNYAFLYRAQQGEFSLSIPRSRCYLIDTDSTVEYIAQHIANRLKAENPNDSFEVKAFEGIGKGAIARA